MGARIPTADEALLEAQATAGMAGVAAYEAASKEMETQRASALAQAQREAASRGAPTAAMEALESTVTGPYDRRIASMAQAGAAARASAERRAGRLSDYNAAVEAARSLIPEQTAQQVAPIEAETSYRLRLADMEGQNALRQIEAQIRLETARAEAAARRAASSGGGGGGGGGGTKTNATELRALLAQPASQRVQDAAQALKIATAPARQEVQNERNRTEGEMRMAQAELEWLQRNQPIEQRRPSAPPRSANIEGYDYLMRTPDEAATMFSNIGIPTEGSLHKQPAPGSLIGRLTAGRDAAVDAIQQAIAEARSPTQTGDRPSVAAADYAMRQDDAASVETDAALAAARRRAAALPDRPPALNMPSIGELLTDQQVMDLAEGPYGGILSSVFDSTTPGFGTNIEQALIGGVDPATGYEAPSASEAMRAAMVDVAADLLEQGYDFDAPMLAAAMDLDSFYAGGDTALDVYAQGAGQDDVISQFETAQSDAQAAYDAAVKMDEQNIADLEELDRLEGEQFEQELRDAFYNTTGLPVPTNVRPEDALAILENPRFVSAVQNLQDYDPFQDDMGPLEYLAEVGTVLDPSDFTDQLIRQILEQRYG